MTRRIAGLLTLLIAVWVAPLHAATPISHEATVWHDPGNGVFSATDQITVEERTSLSLYLAPWLEIEEALVDGVATSPTRQDALITIPLPSDGRHKVTLRYAGTAPTLDPDDRATFGSAGASEEGSYFPASAGWLPITDDPWIAYRLTIEVPDPHRAVGTGHLIEESATDRRSRIVLKAEHPTEPPSLFVGPYTMAERTVGDLRIRTYFHSELGELAETYLDAAASYIARFSDEIGPYPFRDFHIISSPLPVGLGFRNLTYVGRQVLPLPFMRGRSLAHEVLHNWWGNGVAPDYRAGNWAEGLTTYMADYGLTQDDGTEAAREMRLGWLRDYAALPIDRDQPLTAFVSRHSNAAQVIGYNKAALVFHMLHAEIGEAAFATGLQKFWTRHRFQIAGWEEMQVVFEGASGQELGWFFDQWLKRTGAPRLSLDSVSLEETADGHRIEIAVAQAEPNYRLSVPVLIETDDGVDKQTIISTGTGSAIIDVAARPRAIHVDPTNDLFRHLLPGEAPPILRDVTLAGNAKTVIAAEGAAAETARALATRMLDTPPSFDTSETAAWQPGPRLLIGTTAEIDAIMREVALESPSALAGVGTARAWAARHNGHPLLVVAADTPDALEALMRPLPHYGRKSFIVFDGRRAVEKGIWTVTESPLRHSFD
jgi:hypothetical protein